MIVVAGFVGQLRVGGDPVGNLRARPVQDGPVTLEDIVLQQGVSRAGVADEGAAGPIVDDGVVDNIKVLVGVGRAFVSVGDDRAVKINVRLITATKRNLQTLLAVGTLREDFYYRLQRNDGRVFEILGNSFGVFAFPIGH